MTSPLFRQFRFVIVLPQRGQSVLPLEQVVPQLEHCRTRLGRAGFTVPQV